jgi:hypothetical protein
VVSPAMGGVSTNAGANRVNRSARSTGPPPLLAHLR